MAGTDLILAALNISLCANNFSFPIDDVPKSQFFEVMRDAINGKHLKVGTYNNRPMSWTTRDENGKLIGKGVVFEVINDLSHKFNFTYDIVLPNNYNEVGVTDVSGSLVELLVNEKIDIAAALITYSPRLVDNITYSVSLDFTDWVLMYKKPPVNIHNYFVSAAINFTFWMGNLLTMMLYGTCLTLLTRLRATLMNDNEGYIKLSTSFSYLFRTATAQDTKQPPKACMTRILLATWSVCVIVFTSYTTALMTAKMVVSLEPVQIKSAEDFIKYNQSWIAPRGGPIEDIIQDTQAMEHKQFRDMLKNKTGQFIKVDDSPRDFEQALETMSVYIRESPSVYYFIYRHYILRKKNGFSEDDSCPYVVASNIFIKKLRALAYPKNSNLKSVFDYGLSLIIQGGLYGHYNDMYHTHTRVCSRLPQTKSRQLGFYDMMTAYGFLFIGVASGLIALCLEIISKVVKNEKSVTVIENLGHDGRGLADDFIVNRSTHKRTTVYGRPLRREIVNGREYFRTKNIDGETRLIPLNTLSALLYEKYDAYV